MFPVRLRMAVPVAVLLAGFAGQARAAEPQMAAGTGTMSGTGAMQASAPSPADAQMDAGMRQMQKSMQSAPVDGNPDHDFVVMMLPHHEGAVSMAQVELRDGKDPALLKLARGIIAAQDREIAFMKRWLAAHPAETAAAH